MRPKILVADDDPAVQGFLAYALEEAHYEVFRADDGVAALQLLKQEPIDLVLMDIAMPQMDGIAALKQVKEMDEDLPVIMLTASQSIAHAVEAMKLGAFDYVTKPYDPEELKVIIRRAFEKRRLVKENRFYRSHFNGAQLRNQLIGESSKIKDVFRMIHDVARSSATVLITGESGTGKEVVAHAIHELSERSNQLFVAVNCAAIPESLLESTLFGHEKGAFTSADHRLIGKFEYADGGTLFLDEIGCMSLPLQAKLLRVLQERIIERMGSNKSIPVDIRVISATNVDLNDAVNRGVFRKDLFYRLNVVPVHLPPLRERREDIPLLIQHFLEKYNREFGKSIRGLTPEAESLLCTYSWSGNVRELENFIERLVVLGRSEMIDVDQLPQPMGIETFSTLPGEAVSDGRRVGNVPENLQGDIYRTQAEFIRKALLKARGNKKKAAELLGIHRNTLRKRLNEMSERGLVLE